MKTIFNKYLFSPLFIILLLFSFSMKLITEVSKLNTDTNSYSDQQTLMNTLFVLLLSLLIGSIVKIYILYVMGLDEGYINKSESFLTLLIKKIKDWSVTEIRIQFRFFIGLILFIVPGLIEILRLSLSIPFVFFDKQMDSPYFDPIHESRNFITLSSVHLPALAVFTFIIPILLFAFLGKASLLSTSFLSIGLSLLNIFISALTSLAFSSYVLHIYQEYQQHKKHLEN